MSDDKIIALLKQALDEVAPGKVEDVSSIDLNTKIRSVGIDSVATMEMVGVIEEEIEVTFPDEELAAVNTFGDLVTLIKRNQ